MYSRFYICIVKKDQARQNQESCSGESKIETTALQRI